MTYQINSDKILFTQLGKEGVVYDIQTNVYLTLNETFFKILKGVEIGKNQAEIVDMLCGEYLIDQSTCLQEVQKALLLLEEKEYIYK